MDEKRLQSIERRLNASADRDWWTVLVTDDLELTPDDVRDLLAAVRERGEPVAWMYRINNTHTVFSTVKPPDDAYDAATCCALYLAPPSVSAALERAAKVCEDDESGRDSGGYFADAIRKLKEEL